MKNDVCYTEIQADRLKLVKKKESMHIIIVLSKSHTIDKQHTTSLAVKKQHETIQRKHS